MGQREHQSWFSAVRISLSVLVIAALAVTGLVLFQHHKPSNATNSAATSTSQTTMQPQSTTASQPAPTVAYLTIKEWGVKLPLSDSIKDAYYMASLGSSRGHDGQPNTLLAGRKSLDSTGCAATNTTAIALIFRALPTETDSATGKLLTQEYPNGVTLGSYFYAYQQLNSTACKAPQATLQSTHSAFAAAVKGITPATATTN